jgi:TonB family protein
MRNLLCLSAIAVALTVSVRAQDVYKPGSGVTLPTVVKKVNAQYTQEAKDAHIEGTVMLDAVVLADGTVGDVTVTRSLDTTYGLDEQAVKAMKQWQFKPGTKDGKPVAVQVSVEIRFTLK